MSVLSIELQDNIAILRINRPEALNALNAQVFEELDKAVDDIENNSSIRVAILTGEGIKSFAAGADITEFAELDAASGTQLSRRGQKVMRKMELSRVPFIAAVNGFALGGGCELCMACHIRIASDNAKFGQPEVNLGLIPGYGGTQRLIQLVGKGRAMELLLTARMIDAAEALQIGLVTRVTTQEELLPLALKMAANITTKGPEALASVIQTTDSYFSNENGFDVEATNFGVAMASEECKEGTSAFLEKRKANFK
jgi:enoyl-CoA hydratase